MMNNKIITNIYSSPCGNLVLGSSGDRLCLCDWESRKYHERLCKRVGRFIDSEFEEGESNVTALAASQLEEYFTGERKVFDIQLLFAGTDFQQKVWRMLRAIPFGETITYAQVARQMGMPHSVRAVANAVGANPLSLFVPCHRVVGSNNTLTGYAGGLAAKRQLLNMEYSSNWPDKKLSLF